MSQILSWIPGDSAVFSRSQGRVLTDTLTNHVTFLGHGANPRCRLANEYFFLSAQLHAKADALRMFEGHCVVHPELFGSVMALTIMGLLIRFAVCRKHARSTAKQRICSSGRSETARGAERTCSPRSERRYRHIRWHWLMLWLHICYVTIGEGMIIVTEFGFGVDQYFSKLTDIVCGIFSLRITDIGF